MAFRNDPLSRSARHLLVVRVQERDRVMVEMQKRGVGVGVHFRAVHQLQYYRQQYPLYGGTLPVAEKASDEVLSLPFYPSMTRAEAHLAADTLIRTISDIKHNLC